MEGLLKRTAAVAAPAVALLAFVSISASAAPRPASPVTDCNTPNSTGGTGIMLTPANTNGSGQQYLRKVGNGYNSNASSYTFTVTSIRPSGTTFTEFTDCAYSVINGTPQAPSYNENTNSPGFTFSAQCNCWTKNFAEGVSNVNNQPDSICDRVQIKGTDGSTGLSFVDYSNVVLSTPTSTQTFPGAAPSCSTSNVTPEVPIVALIVVAGGGAAAVVGLRRRVTSRVAA